MMRHRQATYGEQIDAHQREVERLAEVVRLHPRREQEVAQGRALIARLTSQMQRLGKRRSSCFYGFEGDAA